MSVLLRLDGVSFTNSNLPTLNDADLVDANFIDVERGAVGHWLLGGGLYSFNDMTAQKHLLMPISNVPPISDNFITVSKDHSLDTGIELGAGSQVTIICVFKNKISNVLPVTTMPEQINDDGTGISLFTTTNGGTLAFSGRSLTNSSQVALDGLPLGDVFTAVSVGNDKVILHSPQIDNPTEGNIKEVSKPNVNAISNNPIAIGSYYYQGAFGTVDVSEVIIFDKALTASEISNVYARSKTRLAKRGVLI
ncbi:hypothetical protein [Pseudoalteromonas sp. ASV78]|uniref:hypothetical protein n=1 Tax=Pseudoalteromonas sp. ASV78 TaxID=3397851 RepID=UPI0039FD3888